MKKAKTAPAKKRSAEARVAWRLGHPIVKSEKVYSRKAKHKKPHRDDGAFRLRNIPKN